MLAFSSLDDEQRIDAMFGKTYRPGATIIRQGEWRAVLWSREMCCAVESCVVQWRYVCGVESCVVESRVCKEIRSGD